MFDSCRFQVKYGYFNTLIIREKLQTDATHTQIENVQT